MSYEASVERYLLEECEKGRAVGPDSLTACCLTGASFITFRSMPTEQGVYRKPSQTISEARDTFLAGFHEYATQNPGAVLYWRHKPKVEFVDGCTSSAGRREEAGWIIYARLVLSASKEQL